MRENIQGDPASRPTRWGEVNQLRHIRRNPRLRHLHRARAAEDGDSIGCCLYSQAPVQDHLLVLNRQI
jgi:hypothetical protein